MGIAVHNAGVFVFAPLFLRFRRSKFAMQGILFQVIAAEDTEHYRNEIAGDLAGKMNCSRSDGLFLSQINRDLNFFTAAIPSDGFTVEPAACR